MDSPYSDVISPSPAWTKPVAISLNELFKALGKAVIHGFAGKWDDAAIDAVEALSAIGIEKNPGELAGLLVRRALMKAMYDLTKENALYLTKAGDVRSVAAVEELVSSTQMKLDPSFFNDPAALPIIAIASEMFSQWLTAAGMPPTEAKGVASRLRTYFTYELNHEWRKNAARYEPIRAAVSTPFTRAGDREVEWQIYSAFLERQIEESMFGEAFSLAQLYVPLRAYYLERREPATLFTQEQSDRDFQRVVVDLQTEIYRWLNDADRDDAVKVISGGPGSGKSSLFKMLAASLTRSPGFRTLFIPLHQFDLSGDLTASVGAFVRNTGILTYNPLDADAADEILLIFDGLDELSMQGKAATEAAQAFMREVERTAARRNYKQLRVRVLLSGRELVVQANATDLRKPKQVLYVLPYYIPPVGPLEQYLYKDELDLLETDQRHLWWRNYAALKGDSSEGVPEPLLRDELSEITAQPLLNYLVALSYTRGRIDFRSSFNLNEVYEDLFQAVYERGYEGQTHAAIRGMAFQQFLRVMEEIGLAAWHGDGRTTTVADIQQHCQMSGLSGLLEVFQDGARAGVTRLLTAFYFRQHGSRKDGEQTFEFTHKSFGEYLAARRVIRAVSRIHDESGRRQSSHDEGWDDRDALRHWLLICGPAPLDSYILAFVRLEIARKSAMASPWQGTLASAFSAAVRDGMPVELIHPRMRHRDEVRMSRNSEEALLVVLNACALVTGKITNIDWPEPTAAGAFLKRVQGQRPGPPNSLVQQCLSYLNLSNALLDMADFYGADLKYSSMAECALNFAILMGADLRHASFRKASMQGANFRSATLDGADFAEAELYRSDLSYSNYDGAKFEGTLMSHSTAKGLNAGFGEREDLGDTVMVTGTAGKKRKLEIMAADSRRLLNSRKEPPATKRKNR